MGNDFYYRNKEVLATLGKNQSEIESSVEASSPTCMMSHLQHPHFDGTVRKFNSRNKQSLSIDSLPPTRIAVTRSAAEQSFHSSTTKTKPVFDQPNLFNENDGKNKLINAIIRCSNMSGMVCD